MIYRLEQFGGGTEAANNSPAWCRMVNSIAAAGDDATIALGSGTYRFAWQPDAIMLSGAQNISVVGESRRISRLFFDQCGGLRILYSPSNWCAAHLRDFGILTNALSQYTGLSLAFAQPPPGGQATIPSPYATSDLVRLSVGGDFQGQWATGIGVSGVSNVNYQDIEVYGYASGLGVGDVVAGFGATGVGVSLDGGTGISVIHNFKNLNASQIGTGLVYGQGVQGVTVTGGSNFTGNTIGISVPVTAGGNSAQTQLCVSDAQFNATSWGIYAPSLFYHMSVRGCLFYIQEGGGGIFNGANASNIIGNTFTAVVPNTNGLVVTGVNCLAMANFFFGTVTGIWLQGSAANCFVIGNSGTVLDSNGANSTNLLQGNSAASKSL